jgi:hypothetical protein
MNKRFGIPYMLWGDSVPLCSSTPNRGGYGVEYHQFSFFRRSNGGENLLIKHIWRKEF